MNNADKPAYPVSVAEKSNGDQITLEGMVDGGLTKREKFAMAAMQGMYSNHEQLYDDKGDIAVWAVEAADALLNELEKTNEVTQ